MCVEVGRVRVDEARERLQTKTKHYNMIFSSVIYIMALTALFWNKEEDSARSQAWKKIKIFYRSALTGLLLCPHPLPSKRGLLQLRLKRKNGWLRL